MKELWNLIVDYAYVVMLFGMAIGIAGLLVLIRAQDGTASKQVGLSIGIVGIVFYILGRIAHVYKSKHSKKKNTTDEL